MRQFDLRSPKLAIDIQPKDKEREELQAQIDEWLSQGNKIEIVPTNEPVRESNYGR